tara:strand:- start:3 stop:170 length:168 start_codon:yes stop_codon:yes gene_type:complete
MCCKPAGVNEWNIPMPEQSGPEVLFLREQGQRRCQQAIGKMLEAIGVPPHLKQPL